MPKILYGLAFRFAQEVAYRKGYELDKAKDGYLLALHLINGRQAIRFFEELDEVIDCLSTGQLMIDYFFVNHSTEIEEIE